MTFGQTEGFYTLDTPFHDSTDGKRIRSISFACMESYDSGTDQSLENHDMVDFILRSGLMEDVVEKLKDLPCRVDHSNTDDVHSWEACL